MAAAPKQTNLEVPPIRVGKMRITLIGDSPLVVNKFSEKAIQMILDSQTGKPKQGKEPKVPVDCFVRALYPLPGEQPVVHDEDANHVWASGRFGFPSIGFKAAAVRAATDADARMTDVRRAFHIPGELVEIQCDPGPVMRKDMVRVGMGTADVRFRPEFTEWKATLDIRYNAAVTNISQITNLFRLAGFGVGVGEWRPERKGSHGMFHVSPEVEDLGEERI